MCVRLLTIAALFLFGMPIVVAAAEADKLPPAAKRKINYERDVLPIFQARCVSCHGPKKQESSYRIDVKKNAVAGGDFGDPAIIPGKSADSPLIHYVAGVDPDMLMPPEGKRLTVREISLLRAWIDQGLVWPDSFAGAKKTEKLTTDWWSFQPLRKVEPPRFTDTSWIANPIDAFILAKLKAKKLTPSPPADHKILARRLFLDMHGLLPSAEDNQPTAYADLVERVLKSPRYGERWARHWLDVVRFAETDGFEMNQDRPRAYHYRDYVIAAFNDDKPYDRFVFEQLAGDAVGVEAATGFIVGGAYDKVKSPDINLTMMQRQNELADMINVTGTTFLGLTVGCARCHNHKFDPIVQTDYYGLQAVFAGVKHGERPLNGEQSREQQQQLKTVERRLKTLEIELTKLGVKPTVAADRNVDRHAPVTARFIRFTILATNNGAEPCIDELEIWTPARGDVKSRNVALASAGATTKSSGDFPGNGKHKLKHLNDGRYGNSRSWISKTSGKGWVQVELAEPVEIDRIVWGRDREGKFSDRLATEYRIEVATVPDQWQPFSSAETRLSPEGKTDQQLGQRLVNATAETLDRVRGLLKESQTLTVKQKQLSTAVLPAVYAGQFEQPGPTHRLYRGDPLMKREPVVPDAVSIIGSLGLAGDAPERERRIALARWITRPNNPLTARVMVNRIWHYHFGTGIVATPSDFGGNGATPTHPDLLDWLAGEFIRGGWSVKHIHRLILNSNTYRQSNAPNTAGLKTDASALLLWRFPPRRLEAETIRDVILQVTGVLDLKAGGPGFSAFKPNRNYVRVYEPKEEFGPADWRRMVYMTKVRMENDAVFGVFDCPDAGQVMPRRSRSTTAIQALNLLNSGFMVQQAELLAKRLQGNAEAKPEQQVVHAFHLVLNRVPEAGEQRAAVELVEKHGLVALCRAMLNANEFLFLP